MNTASFAIRTVSLFVLLLVAPAAMADDFLWQPPDGSDGLWGTTANWQDAAVAFGGTGDSTVTFPPSQIIDRAIIGYSNTTNITLDSLYNIDSIGIGGGTFGEPTITTDYLGSSETLTLSGGGLIANPYSVSPITAGSMGLFGTGSLQLRNSASLNFFTIDNYAKLVLLDSTSAGTGGINNYGLVSFENNASAYQSAILNRGTIQFLNNATLGAGNGSIMDNGGTLNFYDFSNAGSRTINNEGGQSINFYNNANVAQAIINTAGHINFHDASTAAFAQLSTAGTAGASISFFDNSNAGHAKLDNYETISFNGHSNAGLAQITNHGAASTMTFNNFANAGKATITNNGGAITFNGSSSAGAALLQNEDNGMITFNNMSSAGTAQISNSNGATVTFANQASAGSSVIANLGAIYFKGSSTASGARMLNNSDSSVVDLSQSNAGTTIGELSGSGNVFLGSKILTVGTLGTDSIFGGDIQDGGINGGSGGSLVKDGTGKFTLVGANDFTGGVTVLSGTLEVDSSGRLADYSTLTMHGGTFLYYNPADSGSGLSGQVLGPVTFSSGAGNVGMSVGSGSASLSSYLVIDNLNTRTTGATGNFIITNTSSNAQNGIILGTGTGHIVSKSGVNPADEHGPGFLDPGYFVNGNNYAWYDPVSGSGPGIRGINYTSDTGAYTTGATSSISTTSGYQYVQATGAVSAQQTGTFTTLNVASASDFTLADGSTLSLSGILKSGGGTSTISGGSSITALAGASSAYELVVYTAQDNVLNIDTSINASVLTKSGEGTLNLNSSFNGQVNFNEGGISTSSTINGSVSLSHASLNLGPGGQVNGDVSVGNGGFISGSGQVSGKITVGNGGSTYPGDPQILSAGSIEYQSGSTAQFSIATTGGSVHPPVAGTDYDQLQLTANTGTVLQIDLGPTTLQLNMTPTSLAAVQANAANNIADHYFLFTLGDGTSSGTFTDLTVTDGTNTYTGTIQNGVVDFNQIGLQFDLSYTADFSTNSLEGGNDVAFTVSFIPEPNTWAMLAAGFVLLVAGRRFRKVHKIS